MLNQDDAKNADRNIFYSGYIFSARREKMQTYLDAIARIETIEKKLLETNQQLETNRVALETEQAGLVAQREERKQLVAAADSSLKQKDDSLEQMQQDRKALQKVIAEIEKQRALAKAREEQRLKKLALLKKQQEQQERIRQQQEQQAQKDKLAKDEEEARQIQKEIDAMQESEEKAKPSPAQKVSASPAYTAADLSRLQSQSFAQRKGRMPWPVNGKLVTRFGDPRKGSVTWDGLRIQAANGSEVRAVHGGRVMYADSLRGMGLLVVLDHGDGYMSLYAHNDVLLRAAGDWVNPGDSVARAGNSGGEKESGLYFEIRQNGQPVNPLPWLAKP